MRRCTFRLQRSPAASMLDDGSRPYPRLPNRSRRLRCLTRSDVRSEWSSMRSPDVGASLSAPLIRLNNGVAIPQLGLGTARLRDEQVRRSTRDALAVGYRLIDTAASYENEVGVGRGITDSGLDREEVFVSTKLRGADQGYESAKEALQGSLRRLGLEYVDLYLIHWPLPRLDKYVESWKAMEELASEGKTRAIGVSNFLPEHLDRLAAESSTVPAVNQIELHPRSPQLEQQADNARRGI